MTLKGFMWVNNQIILIILRIQVKMTLKGLLWVNNQIILIILRIQAKMTLKGLLWVNNQIILMILRIQVKMTLKTMRIMMEIRAQKVSAIRGISSVILWIVLKRVVLANSLSRVVLLLRWLVRLALQPIIAVIKMGPLMRLQR